ncbi:MAG: hypothetical protein GY818_01060 [Planctomycetaceae bacterium]|nr:hypothetical protein [Planctomycetaceae bacterium]
MKWFTVPNTDVRVWEITQEFCWTGESKGVFIWSASVLSFDGLIPQPLKMPDPGK